MRGTGAVSAPSPDVELRPLADLPFDQVVEHDAGFFGVPRPRFLEPWISPPATPWSRIYGVTSFELG